LALFRSRPALQLEILAFRHQLGALQRSVKRPNLTRFDRLLWSAAVTYLADWRSACVLVKPETVIAWHRKSFCLFWASKLRRANSSTPSTWRTSPIRRRLR
jgi:hypothetical protein